MNNVTLISAFYKPYIYGGAELSNELLVEGLNKKNKIKVNVITIGVATRTENNIKQLYLNKVMKNHLEGKNKNIFLKIQKLFYRFEIFFRKKKFERIVDKELTGKGILHTSGINYFFAHLWWKIGKKKNYKTIHTLRDSVLIYSKLNKTNNFYRSLADIFYRNLYIRYVEKYVDYIHSPTQYMINLHIKNGFKFRNTKVIPNTVNVEFKLSNYKDKIYDVIYVGNLSETKGIKTLIKLKEVNPFLNIILVGSGELENEATKVGIYFTGWLNQNEVFDYMEKSKVVILPSEWEEAFGRVLIEGVASGTVSIGSNMGGIPEVLFNDSRYIFEAKNVSDLKSKIERVLNLDEDSYMSEVLDLQKRMEIYKYENHIKQFEEFYDEVLKNRG